MAYRSYTRKGRPSSVGLAAVTAPEAPRPAPGGVGLAAVGGRPNPPRLERQRIPRDPDESPADFMTRQREAPKLPAAGMAPEAPQGGAAGVSVLPGGVRREAYSGAGHTISKDAGGDWEHTRLNAPAQGTAVRPDGTRVAIQPGAAGAAAVTVNGQPAPMQRSQTGTFPVAKPAAKPAVKPVAAPAAPAVQFAPSPREVREQEEYRKKEEQRVRERVNGVPEAARQTIIDEERKKRPNWEVLDELEERVKLHEAERVKTETAGAAEKAQKEADAAKKETQAQTLDAYKTRWKAAKDHPETVQDVMRAEQADIEAGRLNPDEVQAIPERYAVMEQGAGRMKPEVKAPTLTVEGRKRKAVAVAAFGTPEPVKPTEKDFPDLKGEDKKEALRTKMKTYARELREWKAEKLPPAIGEKVRRWEQVNEDTTAIPEEERRKTIDEAKKGIRKGWSRLWSDDPKKPGKLQLEQPGITREEALKDYYNGLVGEGGENSVLIDAMAEMHVFDPIRAQKEAEQAAEVQAQPPPTGPPQAEPTPTAPAPAAAPPEGAPESRPQVKAPEAPAQPQAQEVPVPAATATSAEQFTEAVDADDPDVITREEIEGDEDEFDIAARDLPTLAVARERLPAAREAMPDNDVFIAQGRSVGLPESYVLVSAPKVPKGPPAGIQRPPGGMSERPIPHAIPPLSPTVFAGQQPKSPAEWYRDWPSDLPKPTHEELWPKPATYTEQDARDWLSGVDWRAFKEQVGAVAEEAEWR
ncbi:MAG: hypothetical protein ABH877_01660, partial [bacterium]